MQDYPKTLPPSARVGFTVIFLLLGSNADFRKAKEQLGYLILLIIFSLSPVELVFNSLIDERIILIKFLLIFVFNLSVFHFFRLWIPGLLMHQ